jgi:hypothetical protein
MAAITLQQAQKRIKQLEADLAEMTRQRDKFRAEWQEALTWQGFWKRKAKALSGALADPSGQLSRREQMQAAKKAAMDSGSMVKV